ncbi:unnamed protein product [Paramecium primaurelia]|uniref:Uncharacterized protein n=1 Tax=Paramecium primaurelia TaxID=5886 RepID=A0A8S1N5G4_PARPR|nr:unnamed protein product [Paramecium primaurelia]
MKKSNENERIAQKIYVSQIQKLQGNILEKKLSKVCSKQKFESQSQNISNNNSPVMGRQQSFENLQKVNGTFINPTLQVPQQKLSSILNVIAGQQTKPKIQSLFTNEVMDTVKISHKLSKNQSMIQIDRQSPQLTKNSSFHRPNSSVKIKNINSLSSEQSQLQKIKDNIKLLLQQRDNNWQQDQKEMTFMIKLNQSLNQLLSIIFQDQPNTQATSTQDTNSGVQLDHFFKRQITILQQFYTQQVEKKKLENILTSIKRKHENVLIEYNQLQEQRKSEEDKVKNLESQIQGLQSKIYTQQMEIKNEQEFLELKYLVQGQFEAIQKLLQREQLTKIFLKRVGDNSILEMFDQFIQNAEQTNMDDTEGNLNIDILPSNKLISQKKQAKLLDHMSLPEKIISQYEENYKFQLNLCDSLLADDSRVNDSEESSFGYMGKEQATEISYYFNDAEQLIQVQNKRNRIQTISKEKLKINMMDVQLAQAVYKHQELVEQQQQQQQQKILPDYLMDNENEESEENFCYQEQQF